MRDLIIKYFNNTITSTEKKAFFSNMMSDEALKKEFAVIQNIRALTALFPADYDYAEGVEKLLAFKQSKKNKSFFKRYNHLTGYAATFCIAVISTWIILAVQQPSETVEIGYQEVSAPAGQRAFVKLHDGTTVWLNARSTLRYPNHFANGNRTVELDGEAFFEVKDNPHKPFIVSTEKLDIEVLGTHFNVFAYSGRNEFKTSLLQGSVKIHDRVNKSDLITLKPTEQVELVDNNLVKTYFYNNDFLLWREGIYSFDDVAFQEIIKKLELYYDIVIAVNNEQIKDYKFSGKFRQRDGVESVLRTLQKVRSFSFIKDEDQNIITVT